MLSLIPMNNCLVGRKFFKKLGGFSSSFLLQRYFWWEFCLRAARKILINQVDIPALECRWSWYNYPFRYFSPLNGDLAARLLNQTLEVRSIQDSCSVTFDGMSSLLSNLHEETAKRLERYLQLTCENTSLYDKYIKEINVPKNFNINSEYLNQIYRKAKTMFPRPLRITIIGGLNEPAHNQLCFFNYFEIVKDWGILTWRTILDTACNSADLINSDLVIFSRVKSDNGCRLMDFCNQQKIPTIYMIDDNWFWVGKEWPDYSNIFAPGLPFFENFLYCLKRADLVLTYNPLLAEDIKPYAKRICRLDTNIKLSLFPRNTRRNDGVTRAGYVGSYRQDNIAFEALAEVMRKREKVFLFVMSNRLPESFSSLPKSRVEFHPYVFNYEEYAKIVCEKSVDILVAPLGYTRFERSKCPNKYLEITAAGAVGVYSDVEPYLSCVRDGYNGLIVKNNIESWSSAILKLVDDCDFRRQLLENAEKDIRERFTTERMLLPFLKMLKDALGGSC
ncbi:hypothetical glycosyltransferase [Pelotomaculum thermopropionicum SI]|uniref:Hypothetical glycosyltransferase n=1 Tax=Pelotomaculum thermopropionicum (strain DSM 13744 / JCM 10971 / SI) TaxID=370438 RepID=A5CZ44_PELTS|nr:hypothetical glycosyltransferase [Pelotomaculum thermopropionicum SI]